MSLSEIQISVAENSLVPVEALVSQLDTLHDALDLIPQKIYQQSIPFKTKPHKFKASAGKHIRHILEFIDTVLNNIDEPLVNYDRRKRDEQIETNPDAAQMMIRRTQERLDSVSPADLTSAIEMVEAVDVHRETPPQGSTFGREVMFAIAHTEHHFALVNERCDDLNIALPDDFGTAVSTRRHELGLKPF